MAAFVDDGELIDHFKKHAARLGIATASEYESRASRFLTGSRDTASTMECQRPQGDLLRFNRTTNEYGVLDAQGIIRTYYIPVPCKEIPADRPKRRCHPHCDNESYFRFECLRRFE